MNNSNKTVLKFTNDKNFKFKTYEILDLACKNSISF